VTALKLRREPPEGKRKVARLAARPLPERGRVEDRKMEDRKMT
jgi:hypothetical protein